MKEGGAYLGLRFPEVGVCDGGAEVGGMEGGMAAVTEAECLPFEAEAEWNSRLRQPSIESLVTLLRESENTWMVTGVRSRSMQTWEKRMASETLRTGIEAN